MTQPVLPLVYCLPPGKGPTTLPRLGRVVPGQHFSPTAEEATRWQKLHLIAPVVPHEAHKGAGGPYLERAPLEAHEEVPHVYSPERLDYPDAEPVPPQPGIPVVVATMPAPPLSAEAEALTDADEDEHDGEDAHDEDPEEELEEGHDPDHDTDLPPAQAKETEPQAPATQPLTPKQRKAQADKQRRHKAKH